MATVLLSKLHNTFSGICERALGLGSAAFGSSRIASPAYQEWPTASSDSKARGSNQATRASHPFKV